MDTWREKCTEKKGIVGSPMCCLKEGRKKARGILARIQEAPPVHVKLHSLPTFVAGFRSQLLASNEFCILKSWEGCSSLENFLGGAPKPPRSVTLLYHHMPLKEGD